MKFIDIVTTIFEYENFSTILIASTLGIFLLFILVLLAGLRDSKKKKEKPVEVIKEELKDVTMEKLKEELIISEEVTLEMPSITKNLEEFKKAIEEEIKHEDEHTTMQVQLSPDKSLLESAKAIKILNINDIENTIILEPKKVAAAAEAQNHQEQIEEKMEEEIIPQEPEIIEEKHIEKPIELREESIVEVQKINIPFIKPDEDEEILFKTMTALRLPQDI